MANKRKTGSRWWKVRVGMCREEVEGEEKEERTREPEDGGSEKVEKGNQSRNGKHKPRALEPGQRGKHHERAANNWLWENVGRVNKITQTFHIETEPELLNPWKRLRFYIFLVKGEIPTWSEREAACEVDCHPCRLAVGHTLERVMYWHVLQQNPRWDHSAPWSMWIVFLEMG